MHAPPCVRRAVLFLLSLNAVLLMLAAGAARAAETLEIRIGYLHAPERTLALSILDVPPSDAGIAGAELAIADNNTTGRFLDQSFVLDAVALDPEEDPLPAAEKMAADGAGYIVVDLPADKLLAIADAMAERGVLVFNAGALDDALREEDCRANVFHIAPTRTMLADGLAQYLVWKRWLRWFLIYGSHPDDAAWADALRRAATRFGARIVEEREFEDTGGARRTDTGHVQVQSQMPVFTQGAPEHDVVVAADESEVFATYLPFRTWEPRPVAGSAGLVPASWHPAFEQWGAMQIQNRFFDQVGRRMLPGDIQAWTAVRIIGEAATRTGSGDVETLGAFIRDPDFSVAAFKGQKLTFRDWNWQLRQPVLLSDARAMVTVSPQEGFLHEHSTLDTLGIDRPETGCALD